MSSKINHRAVLDAGSAILLANDVLQLVTSDGPLSIELIAEGGSGELRWNDDYRKLTLVDFYDPQGSFVSLASPVGKWSLRLTIQIIGQQGTSTAASIVHWQLLER